MTTRPGVTTADGATGAHWYAPGSTDWIGIDDAARYLQLDVPAVTRLVKNGNLKLLRLERGKRQVSRADLESVRRH